MPKLLISDASDEYVYEIFEDEISIGRGAANAVQVADSHASKHHAVVRRIRDHWKFIDLESSNGTRVNGAFANQAWLRDGDEVAIGTSVMRYQADGANEGPPEVVAAKPRVVDTGAAAGRDTSAAAGRPAAVAPRAVPAKPVPLAPAPVEPAEPEPSRMLEEVVPMGAAAGAPARRRAGGAARGAARRSRRDEDDYYDDEDDGRPRRAQKQNNSLWIGLGLGLGAIVFTWIIFMIFDQTMSHNRKVLYEARKLAAEGNYQGALDYCEQNGQESGKDFDTLTTGAQDFRNTLATKARMVRGEEAQNYYKYEIYRKSYSETKSTTTRPVGALPDSQIIPRIRDFLKLYWDTPVVHTFLASEHDAFPYYRNLLRTNPDDTYTAGKALGEIRDEVDNFAIRREWGRAVKRLKRHSQIGRLAMLPEQWKLFDSQAKTQIQGYEERAARELTKELAAVHALMDEGDRDLATQKVRVMGSRYSGIPTLLSQVHEIRDKYSLRP